MGVDLRSLLKRAVDEDKSRDRPSGSSCPRVPEREAADYREADEREEMLISGLCEGSAVERLSEHGGFNPVIHKELRRK